MLYIFFFFFFFCLKTDVVVDDKLRGACGALGVSWGSLGALLGGSWEGPGEVLGPLGASWGFLGHTCGLLKLCSGSLLGVSCHELIFDQNVWSIFVRSWVPKQVAQSDPKRPIIANNNQ